MPKYLLRASYTQAGAQGLLKDGGSKRLEAIQAAAASTGGTVEAAYWAFGKDDFVGIFEFPDNAAAAALSLTVSASGAVSSSITVLMSAAEVDAAAKLHPSYRPPGA
jgi:uncharacterized protein with GYD domain